MIVIVFGQPGSGKSHFARALSTYLSARLFSSDDIRKKLRQTGRYNVRAKSMDYQEIFKDINSSRSACCIIVLNAICYKSWLRDMSIKKVRELSEPIFFIEVVASLQSTRNRLKVLWPNSETDFGVYLKINRIFEPLRQSHLVLHSDEMPLNRMMLYALRYLTGECK